MAALSYLGFHVVFLAPLGPPAARNARATFARHVFGVAGFDVREHVGFSSPTAAVDAAAEADCDVLVVCSADEQYSDLVPAVRGALQERGRSPLLAVAADPDRLPAPVPADTFVHRGAPLRDLLESIQDRLGFRPD